MSKLIIRYPNNVIKEAEFDQPKYKIGTAPDNDLVLENEEVQAHQAEIDTVDGSFSIADVSENKSTTVNGKKFDRVNLNYGDRIAFGPVVGLFYPSKKEAVGDKTKLFLFLAAGGFVLIISVGLMFYLASRRITTAMTEQIGGTVTPREEVRLRPRQTRVKREKQQRKPAVVEEQTGEGELTTPQGGQEGTASDGTRARPREYRELVLPEPTPEQIRARPAVAVPRGIGGLFFRKIPVIVSQTAPPAEGALAVPEQTTGGVPAGEQGREQFQAPAAAGEEGLTAETGGQTAQTGEGVPEGEVNVPEKKGFLSRVFSPITRLFGGGSAETTPAEGSFEEGAPAEESGAGPGAETSVSGVTEGGRSEAKPEAAINQVTAPGESTPGLQSDIAKLVEPLSALRKLDIPELKRTGFDEKPVYNESEILTFKKKNMLGETRLSDLADVGVNTLWEYNSGAGSEAGASPAGGGERTPRGDTVTRTGVVGRLGGGRKRDLVFGTSKGALIGLSGDGTLLFARDLGKEHGGAFYEPLLGDLNKDGRDDIVVVFENGTIASYGRNGDRLDQMWVYEGKGRITSLPAFTDISGDGVNDLVFPTLGMDVVAVDGKTGFELWRFFDATGEILSSPAGIMINGDSTMDIVFVSVDGFLYGVDGKTGWALWKSNISGRPSGGPAVGPIGEGKEEAVVTLTRNGMLCGHDRSGKPLFTYDMKTSFVTGPSIGDTDGDGKNEIVTIDVQGVVRAVEGATRREKWRFQSEAGTAMGRIALADMNGDVAMDVVFTTLSGVLTVLDGKTGTVAALRNIRDFSFATPLIADLNGDKKLEMITAGRGGGISAVQVSATAVKLISLKKSSWPSVNRDGRNTGCSKFSFRDRGY